MYLKVIVLESLVILNVRAMRSIHSYASLRTYVSCKFLKILKSLRMFLRKILFTRGGWDRWFDPPCRFRQRFIFVEAETVISGNDFVKTILICSFVEVKNVHQLGSFPICDCVSDVGSAHAYYPNIFNSSSRDCMCVQRS